MIGERKRFEKYVKKNEKRIDGIFFTIGDSYDRAKTVEPKKLKRALNQAIAIAKEEGDKVHGHICWNDDEICPSYLGFVFKYYK